MKPTVLLSPAFPAEKNVHLQAVIVSGVEIDICPLTGGIWFDRFEIKKFDETHEDLSELINVLPKNPIAAEITEARRSPRHPEAIMQQMPYGPSGANGVLTIDKCPVSAGIWLDYQELHKIRELYPKEEDKNKAITKLVKEALPDSRFPSHANPQRESFLYSILKSIVDS